MENVSEIQDGSDSVAVQQVTSELYSLLQKAALNQDPNAILDIDVAYFCEEALSTFMVENVERCAHLVKALVHIYAYNNCDLSTEEIPTDVRKCKKAQKPGSNNAQLSESYLAGLCLRDLAENFHWKKRVFSKSENGPLLQVSTVILLKDY